MNTTDNKHFEILFNAMKDQLVTKLNLEADNLETLSGGDIIDKTTSERDSQLLLKLQGRDRFFLKKIDHALDKIEHGTFGECEECGDDISMKRLLARPIATQCIHCKEDQEREEGQVLYEKRSKTLGKEINNDNKVVAFSSDTTGMTDTNIISLDKWSKKMDKDQISS